MTTSPLDVITSAITANDPWANPRTLAESAARALTTDAIVEHAAEALAAHGWTAAIVEEMSARDLRTLINVAFSSIAGGA